MKSAVPGYFNFFFSSILFLSLFSCGEKEKDPRERYSGHWHSGPVNDVAFSNDGKMLATGSDDGTIRVFDTTMLSEVDSSTEFNASLLSEIEVSPLIDVWDGFTSIDFSHEGSILVAGTSASIGGHLLFFDLFYGHSFGDIQISSSPIRALDTSPIDDSVVVGTGTDGGFGDLSFVDFANGTPQLLSESLFGGVSSVRFSDDGASFLGVGNYGSIFFVSDIDSGFQVLKDDDHLPYDAAFLPDTDELVSVGEDAFSMGSDNRGALHIWNLSTSTISETVNLSRLPLRCLTVSSNGGAVAAAGEGHLIYIVRMDTHEVFTVRGHFDTVNSLAFSPDGRWLVSVGDDHCLFFWDVDDLTGPIELPDAGVSDGGYDS